MTRSTDGSGPDEDRNLGPQTGNCFGCASDHEKGLRMTFARDGEGLVANVRLCKDYESYPGVVHGGIVATLLDEAMARIVLTKTGTPTVTVGMRVRYARVMRSRESYRVVATMGEVKNGVASAEARVLDEDGATVAAAGGTFLSLPGKSVSAESGFPTAMIESIVAYQG